MTSVVVTKVSSLTTNCWIERQLLVLVTLFVNFVKHQGRIKLIQYRAQGFKIICNKKFYFF